MGGAESLTTDLAVSLRQRGVDAHVVFVEDGEGLAARLDERKVPHRALGLGRGREVLRHPRAIAQLVSSTDCECAILVSSGYLASALRIGGFHQPIAAVEHGGLLQVEQMPLLRRLPRRVDRLSGVWACDVEVAVSCFVLETLRTRRHARELICIRNGVDLERFFPPERKRDGGPPFTLGYAGRLIPGKGVGVLIRAFASMRTSDASLLRIAGDGPEREALEKLALTLGIQTRTRFLGRIEDTPRFWQGCDVAVVPSSGWVESFCLSAVEAMASGCPVVASRTGALPEIVPDEVAGILVDEGDSQELSEALDRYAQDVSLRHTHGRAARDVCEREYDLVRTVDGYLGLIGRLSLGRRRMTKAKRSPRFGGSSSPGLLNEAKDAPEREHAPDREGDDAP